MKPRPYQTQGTDWIIRQVDQGKHPLLVSPTGTGKSLIFCMVAKHYTSLGHNVMVMVRGISLVTQAAQSLARHLGEENVQIEMAQDRAYLRPEGGMCIVSSVDTLRGRRLKMWQRDSFKLIIVDESHRSVAASFCNVFDHFSSATRAGVTATPRRADKVSLANIYNASYCPMSLLQAIQQGYLVPVNQHYVPVEGLDLSALKTKKRADNGESDFSDKEISAAVDRDEIILKMVKPALQMAGDRPTIFFCSSVAHAHHVTTIANKIKENCCECVASYELDEDGNTTDDFVYDEETGRSVSAQKDRCRERILKFKEGKVQCLASVGMLTEGFDAPLTACLVMLRPTKSGLLYAQCLGRGTRPLPGVIDGLDTDIERRSAIAASGKKDVLVLDYVGNAGKHSKYMVSAVDILFESADADFIEKIKQNLQSEGGSVEQAQDKAKKFLEDVARKAKQNAEEEARKAQEFYDRLPRFDQVRRYVAQNAEVSYTTHYVPLDEGRGAYQTESKARYPASPAQQEALLKLSKQLNHGLTADQIAAMDVRDVTRRITHLRVKRAKGAPSSGQAYVIQKAGYAVPATWDQAHQLIDKIKRANGGQLP